MERRKEIESSMLGKIREKGGKNNMVKKYLKTGVGLIGTSAIVGSIPNISGTSTEANLKAKFGEGLGNVGTALPVYGSALGARMTFNSIRRLKKSSRKLLKGGRRL